MSARVKNNTVSHPIIEKGNSIDDTIIRIVMTDKNINFTVFMSLIKDLNLFLIITKDVCFR